MIALSWNKVADTLFFPGTTFAGSSSLFSLTPGSGQPRLLHVMGRREEGLAVWTYPSEK